MVKKAHIENFLRLNGLSVESSDAEIKSLLITARWQEEDALGAIAVLRGTHTDSKVNEGEVEDMARKELFHGNAKLSPESLSSLLGIDVEVKHTALAPDGTSTELQPAPRLSWYVLLLFTIVFLASFGGGLYFHSSILVQLDSFVAHLPF